MEISPCSGQLLSVLCVITHLTNEARIVIIAIFQIRKQTQSLSNFPRSESQGWLMVMPRFEPMPSAPESTPWINILLTLRATNKTISGISKDSVDFQNWLFQPRRGWREQREVPMELLENVYSTHGRHICRGFLSFIHRWPLVHYLFYSYYPELDQTFQVKILYRTVYV